MIRRSPERLPVHFCCKRVINQINVLPRNRLKLEGGPSWAHLVFLTWNVKQRNNGHYLQYISQKREKLGRWFLPTSVSPRQSNECGKWFSEETRGTPVLQRLWKLTSHTSRKLCKSLWVPDLPTHVSRYHHSLFHFQQKQISVWRYIYIFSCTNVKILSLTDGNMGILFPHSSRLECTGGRQNHKWYTVNDTVSYLKHAYLLTYISIIYLALRCFQHKGPYGISSKEKCDFS